MVYPDYIDEIICRLENAGETAYIVGGSIRDMLRGEAPHDYDLTTSALPQKILEIFSDRRLVTAGIKHGTVTVIWNGEPVEITTFRIDGSYTDARHPDSVEFTDDIICDLSRRDFTVNAMAYSKSRGLVDPFGGAEDIKKGIIRAVGAPEERFGEDALRIMRAFRFSAQLGFEPENGTLDGAVAAKEGLSHIARERIGSEFNRLITSPYPYTPLSVMAKTGILKYVTGDFVPSDRVMSGIEKMPCDIAARLGFFLCELEQEAAREILESLRCSGKQITGAMAVALGSRECIRNSEDARRLIAKTGIYAEWAAAASILLGNSPEGADSITERQRSTPCSLRDLKINGKTISELGVRGKLIGEVLDALLELVIREPSLNEAETLRALAQKIINEKTEKEERV